MSRYLWVGDPHVQKSNLDESRRLFAWVKDQAAGLKAQVIIAGDLYNDFSLMRVEVAEFWHETLAMLSDPLYGVPIVIEGNHDQTPDGTQSALTVHEDLCDLMRNPMSYGDIGFMPFIRDNEKFIQEALSLYGRGVRTIYCHAEFQGSQYENGFYAPHGIDLSRFPTDLKFISGHIHKRQEFGNVWYPGTPRHLTRSDVGESKGIWLIDGQERRFVPTPEDVCVPFREILLTPESLSAYPNIGKASPSNERLYVDVRGPKDFVAKTLKILPGDAKVRTFVDAEQRTGGISESDGIPTAFIKYMSRFAAEKSMQPEVAKAVLSRIYDRCPSLRIG